MYQLSPFQMWIMLPLLILTYMTLLINLNLWKTFLMKKKKNFKTSSKSIIKMSLFMSFDPSSSLINLEMNWSIMLMMLLFLPYKKWVKPNRMQILANNLMKTLTKQFSIALKTLKDAPQQLWNTLFCFIMFSNLIGLFPYNFTISSHLSLNLAISMSMWTGLMMFGFWKFPNEMFSHLVPSGTPTLLISFMVLIESISNIIRPLTLSIRLMANMVSGHLLLTLLGNLMTSNNLVLILILTSIQCLLMILEISVAIIQAYVYSILLTLYSDESEF